MIAWMEKRNALFYNVGVPPQRVVTGAYKLKKVL